ncbi:FG-GAP-like repeat-containing protein [Phenylobacterium sp.]|uniref:FG-GAP-like repeat-containing protein n=1 Tax=Phenylobacterium sp. TaxID=1871053 RepID=UPI0035B0A07E
MPTYFSSTEFRAPLRAGFENASHHEIAVGDFTGDGKVDFVVSYFLYPLEDRSVPVRVMVGDGQGGFTDQTATLFGAAAPRTVHAREAVVGDFNRDGRADLFIADHGYDAQPFPGAQNALVLSSGATGLVNATGQLPAIADYSHSAEAADIDRDGDLDIYVGNGGGGTGYTKPFFLINNGQGGFTRSDAQLPATVLNGANHWTEAFVDVEGDGDLDLFLGSSLNSGSRLLLNNGQGVFTESGRNLPRGAANADGVEAVVMDVNRDGRPDLLVGYTVPTGGDIQRQFQVLLNDGQGGFTEGTAATLPAAMLSGTWVRRFHLTDVNGDGLTDIVLSDRSTAPVHLNDGAGHFVAMPGLLPGNEFDQITPLDVNGDGRTDFVAVRGKWDGQEQFRVDIAGALPTNQAGAAVAESFMAGARATTVNAGAGDDVIVGGAGDDYLRGDEGNDRIAGGDGFDDVHGNMGDDTVSGGRGPDWVVGGKDNDRLFGEDGDDVVYGNLGDDTQEGGAGADWVRGGQGNDVLTGGAGDDWMSGDRHDDTLTGGTGADIFNIFGEAGTDLVTDFNRAEGDRVKVEPGFTYTVAQSGADVVISLSGGAQMRLAGVQMSSLTDGWIYTG